MRVRPLKKCRLCFEEALLCDSHLIPKAMYRAYDIRINRGGIYPIAKQLKDYLLCEKCEQLFRGRGEDWATSNCARYDGTFRARDLLKARPPASDSNDIHLYYGSKVPGFDVEALIYFAMSVFWRAAVHDWRDKNQVTRIELGPFEERIRAYLRGDRFPQDVALTVRVIDDPDVAYAAYAPVSGKVSGFHYHKFLVGGFVFILFVGSKIPQSHLDASTAPSADHVVSIHPKSDQADFQQMVDLRRVSFKD